MKPRICPTCGRRTVNSKSHEQRKKFHAICTDIGRELGHTPGQVKEAIKAEHFGLDEVKIHGKWYRMVKSSEDADRLEYSELIETALRCGAEWGVVILDTQ